jgi:hypothetical protein
MFPFEFHRTPGAVAVTASFGCPSIVSNRGDVVSEGPAKRAIEALRDEWAAQHPGAAKARELVPGRAISSASLQILRDSLLAMLDRRDDGTLDLTANLQRIAATLDDLTRQRVIRLPDESFADYIKLTLPYAAASPAAMAIRSPGAVARLLQYGFLYGVAAIRYRLQHRSASPWRLRLKLLQLLAHFHGIAASPGSIDVRRLHGRRVDLDAPDIQPIARHYMRTAIGELGARERPIVPDLVIAMSCLIAAGSLASAAAGEGPVDRDTFATALMESIDISHTSPTGIVGRILPHLTAGTDALRLPALSRRAK